MQFECNLRRGREYPLDPESLYLQLGQLVAEMPELQGTGPISHEVNRWLGHAARLVRVVGNLADASILASASNGLDSSVRDFNAQTIRAIVYRALALAEANAPTAARGGFIGAGAALDALQVVGKVLAEAKRDALIVDAYMDSKVFTDFAPTAGHGVSVRVLADRSTTRPEALLPGLARWKQQFGEARPIEVRLSAPRALHDRLIFADGTLVWTLSQSLKDFATRSHALVQRLDPDLARMKVAAYGEIWNASTPL